jgi:AhpD family alkylhydroperoxidase
LWCALLYDISSLPCRPSGGCLPAKTTKQSEDIHNPYGYSEMDWAAQLDPAYAIARAEVRRLSVGEEGTLSVKVKELIVLGILASRGLQYGVEAHMRRALDYGATKDELFEAIKAAAVPGGGVAYSVGVRALQALEQDGAFPPPSPPPPARRQPGKAAPQPRASRPTPRRREPPPSGDGAGHTAPRKQPPGEARLGGRLTSARDTRLLRAGAFSGRVPLGILRSRSCGGAAV